jgi:transposase InsO family protein
MESESGLPDTSVKAGRKIKGLSDTEMADLDKWPYPDEGAFAEDHRVLYLNRKNAVKLYVSGSSAETILDNCGFTLSHVYRLITERCLCPHPDGLIYGWRALVPNAHIRPYRRQRLVKPNESGHGASGALQAVLDLHPELRKAFEKRILASCPQNKLGAVKRPRQAHWKWFLDELRKLGYEQQNKWPFNTKNNGYVSICNYMNDVLDANPKQAARVLGGEDAGKKLIASDGVDRPVTKVFQRVEMDAHKIDGRFCVMMPTLIGGHIPKIIHRIWVVVIIDVFSRAVLGYYLSLGVEVSKDDVMRTLKMALTRWQRRNLTFSDKAYHEGGGLPSGVSDNYVGVCWDETSVDGALAETCKHVESVLRDTVGSVLINPKLGFSSRRSKDDRPFIEAFFRTLGTYGFQKLSNTTGSKPEEKQGRNPDEIALTSQFQLEYAEELLDVLIANYNAMPHTGLGYRSPLEYLRFVCASPGTVLRYADPNAVQGLLSYRKKCRVNGDLKQGRKPYVHFEGARYTNEALQQRFDLVDDYVWVVNHLEDDARVALASTLEGQQLGILRAAPPWHRLPHSLKVRQAINTATRKRLFAISSNVDAVEAFLDFYETQADKKLPVHPAYLEARRILAQQADLNRGDTVLDNALAKAEITENPTRIPKPEKQGVMDSDNLPPRRMAVSN